MKSTIENAKMVEIRKLLEERGVMEGFAKMNRKKFIKVLNTHLYCSGLDEWVKPQTTIVDAKEVPYCEFSVG